MCLTDDIPKRIYAKSSELPRGQKKKLSTGQQIQPSVAVLVTTSSDTAFTDVTLSASTSVTPSTVTATHTESSGAEHTTCVEVSAVLPEVIETNLLFNVSQVSQRLKRF